MKYKLIVVGALVLGFIIGSILPLWLNRICFSNGECKTFYTAQELKTWLYQR